MHFSQTLHSVEYTFPFLPCFQFSSFLRQPLCKAYSDTLPFFHLFFFGMVLLTASCIIVQTSVRSYSGTLFTRSNHLNLFITSTTYSSPPLHIHQFSSVVQSCLTLCDPMDFSMPGFPVHYQLPELTQTHVQVSDAIQPSHPMSSPSPPAFNLSQHQDLF